MSEPGASINLSVLRLGNAITVTILLFIVAMIVGWIGTARDPTIGNDLLVMFQKEIAGQITIGNPVDMCVKLFANNLEACILLFLGGPPLAF